MEKHRHLIYNIIYNFPVSDYADKAGKIKIAVTGTGAYAELLVRTLVWAAQGDDINIEIAVIEMNLYNKLLEMCPEFFNPEALSDSEDINYCIRFSENNPSENALHFDCSENGIIMIFPDKSSIGFTGNFSFSDDIFSNGIIEKTAKRIFNPWKSAHSTERADEFFLSEFNYNSSCAAALFWLMRKNLNKDISVNDKNMRLEHRRWNAYMRSEGYRYSQIRDDEQKTHPCLVRYDELTEEMQSYDANPIRSVNDIAD